MKNRLLVSALALGVTLSTASAQTNALKHRYSFNTSANDLAGAANGTLLGGATLTNGALVLNGSGGYLALPANLVTGYTAISLEAWVTDNGSGNWSRIYDFGNNTTVYMFLSLPSGSSNLRGAYTTNSNGAEQVLQWPNSGRPPVGQPAHIVWTSDGASHLGLLYVNGVPVATNVSMTLTPDSLGPTTNNWLGRSQWSGDPYFKGSLDEFRIYNVALSSNVIAQDFQAGPDKFQFGPVCFVTQPQSQSVDEMHAVSFVADVDGTPPYSLQWYRNGEPLAGETNLTLTFAATLADSNAVYQLWATNSFTNTIFVAASSNATLLVSPDTTPPVLLSAQGVSTTGARLFFSEPIRADTATNLANYTLTGPGGLVTINAATQDASGTIITLSTAPLLNGSSYTVTVTNLCDPAGLVIAPGSQATFTAWMYVTNSLTVQADQPGIRISSNLFGIFFEEINYAGDGGIYAEMVRNRAFYNPTNAYSWSLVTQGTASGNMTVDSSFPLNTNTTYALKLTLDSGTGSIGAANNGYWGMALAQGALYDLSFYASGGPAGFSGPVTVRLESTNGLTQYAQASFTGLTTNWQRFAATLTSSGTATNARLVVSISDPGSIWLDVVSLFPRATFNSHTNGMRPAQAGLLAGLKPSFMRFPGGCYVEGNYLSNAFRWKKSIGDPAGRPGHWNGVWGYWSTDGLGYHEYLQLSEDLGAEPLFVINCGMAHGDSVPAAQMGPWVQDALDAIQYANGDTNTVWGALRAANGHPAPFNLKYMEIGNENSGGTYNTNYALFYDAIKSNYPDIHLVADTSPSLRPAEIIDEHYYSSPSFFMQNATKYDSYSRSGRKVYVGEYAVTSGSGNGNLAGALGEAAFMTGMERNSDVVIMASYAPLFGNANGLQWRPDLIYYDSSRVYGTPSYYVQQMFSVNRGDFVLPTTAVALPPAVFFRGAIGLGTWNTQSAYSNLVVTAGGSTLYQSDFSTPAGTNGWQIGTGTWVVTNGVFQQTAGGTDRRATYGNTSWSNYTYTLRAKKLSGSEGFLIMFNVLDSNNYMWWNIGGWNNSQTAIEWAQGGSKTTLASVSMSIATNTWYAISIQLSSNNIICSLNGSVIHNIPNPYPSTPLYASSSLLPSKGQVIVKAVNTGNSPLTTQVGVNAARGLAPAAPAVVLTSGNALDENSLAQPNKVFPVTNTVSGVATNFQYTFPANSLTVLRFQELPDSPVGITLGTSASQLDMGTLSNGIPIALSSFITNNVAVNYTVDSPAGVLASGTVQFAPGDLGKLVPLAIPNLQNYSLVRVTLSNPVNGQLTGVTQTYYVNLPDVDGRPVLGLAQFPDQTLLYWCDAACVLCQADVVLGPWTDLTNMPSPVSITLTNPQQFYLLKR